MSERSAIEWTDSSWNPIRARRYGLGGEVERTGWYCEKVSPGCTQCYAERLNKRLGTGLAYKGGNAQFADVFLDEKTLTAPLRWRKPRKVFVASMTDLFGEWVPNEWIDRVFAVMAMAPRHTFQVLTKRADRLPKYVTEVTRHRVRELARGMGMQVQTKPFWITADLFRWPLPNVWLGVSAEDQQRLDERVPELLATPAAVTWISAEPLLGQLDFGRNYLETIPGRMWKGYPFPMLEEKNRTKWLDLIDWVVVGSESGPVRRDTDTAWVRSIRDQCQAAGVPLFLKQLHEGGKKISLPDLDGRIWNEFPRMRGDRTALEQ